jgi:hypothetical protein
MASQISNLKVLRSSELVMLAYENGYFKSFQKIHAQALEAALYKIKFAGCSITFEEITEYLATVK